MTSPGSPGDTSTELRSPAARCALPRPAGSGRGFAAAGTRSIVLGLLVLSSAGCGPKAGLEAQLEREVRALSQRMRMLEEDLASCGTPDAPRSLYAELFQVFSGSGVSIDQRGPATIITLKATRLFTDPWGSDFRAEADPTLDLLATALLLNPEYDITVVGHTSNAPIPASHARRYFNHVALSLGLSARVADHLMTNYAVPESRFTVAGRGTWDSVASNDDDDGRDANQRVEVHLTRAVSIGEAAATEPTVTGSR